MIPRARLPFVSIGLLTYNRAGDLPRSIDSLLNQTHCDFELIISDDRSLDHTEAICREYELVDSRVKYFKNKKNLRYADNQNIVIERARSDYVAIVHDGDIYRSDLIEKWTQALVNAPQAGLVFNQYRIINKNGLERIQKLNLPEVSKGESLMDSMFDPRGCPIFGIVMVRKSAIMRVGRFDNRFPTLADVDMWMRLLARFDVAYVREPLITISPRELGHHNNPGNIRVREQLEHIYLLNAARYFGANSEESERVRRRLAKALRQRNFRSVLWCLKSGKFDKVCDWIKFYFVSAKRHQAFWNEGIGG